MISRKLYSTLAAFVLVLAAVFNASQASASTPSDKTESRDEQASRVREPLNLAILVQDDLVSRVGNEIAATKQFIRTLPAGSRVMVAYVTTGSLQVRQPFTNDLESAAKALRIPIGSTSVSPYNPYVEVKEALRRFEGTDANRNALLLISDGLDVSRGFDASSTIHSIDLDRAIREAKTRNVQVYSFYAPSVGLTSWNRTAIAYGQSALNRLSDETGGRAFFQGTSFVSFNPYFKNLSRSLNRQTAD